VTRARLLIARAEPEAGTTAALVERLGGEPILAPMRTAIQIIRNPPLAAPSGLIATSARAFRLGGSIPAGWRDLPCFVVGDITDAAAREAGFSDIHVAGGETSSLVPLLADYRGQSLVYLAGEPRRPELEADAKALSIRLVPWLRYRMEEAGALPKEAHSALAEASCDAVLHFSRESVASLLRLTQQAGLISALAHPVHACLSPVIAESLLNGLEKHHVAPRTTIAQGRNAEALIEAALQACRNGTGRESD
jgi:uroporphyrinogen-III synthase